MKILIIGLGSIGQRHLRNLLHLMPDRPTILAVRRGRTVALLVDAMRADKATVTTAEKYGIVEFDDLDVALAEKPDFAMVTNPSCFHVTDALACLRAGVHVFIEKPLGADWVGVEELVAESLKNSTAKALVGYQFRFHPAMQKIRAILQSGELGQVVSARFINGEYLPFWHPYEDYKAGYAAQKKLGGGALVTQIHDFDLTYWFFGIPHSIYSVGGHLSSLEVDIEDCAVSLLSYAAGKKEFPVSISLDYLQYPPEHTVTITGDKGSVSWSSQTGELSHSFLEDRRIVRYDFKNFERNEMFIRQAQHFLDVVAGLATPEVSVHDASLSLKMALAAKQSINSAQPVRLEM